MKIRHAAGPGRGVLLLGAVGALLRSACFVRPAPFANAGDAGQRFPGRVPLRTRVARRAGSDGDAEGYKYAPFVWMVNFGISDEQLGAVIARVPDTQSVWPDSSQTLMREDFRQRVKGGGPSSSASALDDAAIDAIFNQLGGTSGVLLPANYDQVAETIGSWRQSSGGPVNFFAVQQGILASRLTIFGAWFFLYIFSGYAGYFVIGRPILYQLFGIDLLPNLKRFWEVP